MLATYNETVENEYDEVIENEYDEVIENGSYKLVSPDGSTVEMTESEIYALVRSVEPLRMSEIQPLHINLPVRVRAVDVTPQEDRDRIIAGGADPSIFDDKYVYIEEFVLDLETLTQAFNLLVLAHEHGLIDNYTAMGSVDISSFGTITAQCPLCRHEVLGSIELGSWISTGYTIRNPQGVIVERQEKRYTFIRFRCSCGWQSSSQVNDPEYRWVKV